ncbi:hypothetical protein [Cryobacterium sp. Y11]|uniref:hypothetical protein n=1 Tax=Cryobacterium sp. Y11 TaxID=2045016 RepID=UPI000CE55C0D|nr:hypothetical protein [Cryobacterium sp. Y11]
MTTGIDPGLSAAGQGGLQINLTVLAEGPFTTVPRNPSTDEPELLLTTTLRVPVQRIGPGPRSVRFDVIVRRSGEKPFRREAVQARSRSVSTSVPPPRRG